MSEIYDFPSETRADVTFDLPDAPIGMPTQRLEAERRPRPRLTPVVLPQPVAIPVRA